MHNENPTDSLILQFLSIRGSGAPAYIASYIDRHAETVGGRLRAMRGAEMITYLGEHNALHTPLPAGRRYIFEGEGTKFWDDDLEAELLEEQDYRVVWPEQPE